MKRATGAIVGGLCLGAGLIYIWRYYAGARRIHNLHLTSQDLKYSNHSPEELVVHHLIDLNGASAEQIAQLGLSTESVERLLENRPYRNNLDLLSRMVVSQDEYSSIKDKVSITEAGEPVKIA
jgi:hypothetical protein